MLAVVLALVGCSSGEAAPVVAPSTTGAPTPSTTIARTTTSPAPTTTLPPTTTTPPIVVPDLGRPALGATSLTGPSDVGPELDQAGRDTVSALLADYAARGIAEPLATGGPAELTGLLSSVLEPRLTPDQRAVLTDEGVPRLRDVQVERFDATADALAGPDGLVGVVNCRLDLVISGVTADTSAPVTIARSGDLTYAWEPDGAGGGAWRIDSFALQVDRTVPA